MKRFTILILAAVLVLAMSTMVMAIEVSDTSDVTVTIGDYILASIDNISLNLDDPVTPKSSGEDEGNWEIETNVNFTITFESDGIRDEQDQEYNKFFRYNLHGDPVDGGSFDPGGDHSQANVADGSYEGYVELEFLGVVDEETLDADKVYSDTVTLTVSQI